ncbi:uncharacterized protein BX664DRAFT_72534 [Halteromyces radiatus]|uniref:uncharacterized protein n=1 Tax=Halteromyces radiatus TaxID=101107 RepID=UPI00221E9219|nr:uncharacterized protein BX664DRAFT_72534 [Halteromyces radiatus]KAI8097081.1 hypothetical protein BX664DRAFT_72534 [Halteromyces radiatus]
MPRPLEHTNVIDRDPLYRPSMQPDPKEKLPSSSAPSSSWLDLKQAHTSLLLPKQVKSTQLTASWESTLEKCIKSIVSIKATRVRCLDTEIPGVFSATGFVVDANRGIILSNRHVVSVSPIVAQAVLCNYEEIDLKPIYRDPIHDFGFLQYDPSKVRFLNMPSIELYPEGARVGQEIRVVGNDAGEKLSILSGTLARLDREAPDYGIGEYNDFNTFYLQAASSTSAGSSGSPVLDLQGRAIALNAGGAARASSSYYFPLQRVRRALQCIQQQSVISRGTLQTEFVYRSYDELLQLGLAKHIEQRLRSLHRYSGDHEEGQEYQGLLVVKSLLPDGPASKYLEPGDILLTGNGAIISTFIELEDILDSNVNKSVCLVVSRAGELKEYTMTVQDLHQVTPHRYVEFGGGVMHDLSYQMAHSYGLSLKNPGVYVAASGYIMGTAYAVRRSVILGLDNHPIHDLDDFIRILQQIPHGSRVPIRFYSLSRAKKDRVMLVHVDRRWHRFCLAIRNDRTGVWDYQSLESTNYLQIQKPILPYKQDSMDRSISPSSSSPSSSSSSSSVGGDPLQKLSKSLVSVDCYPPFIIDGLRTSHAFGAGLIVSLDPPLVICDRDTVPTALSDISLTVNNSVTVSARLEFLHPFYNFAILSFDPIPLFSAGLEVHAAKLSDVELERDDKVNYVGLGGDSKSVIKKTYIATLRAIRTKESTPPRWRAVNVQALKTGESLTGQGGALADDEGRVQAFWMTFATEDEKDESVNVMGGLPSKLWKPTVIKMIQAYKNQEDASWMTTRPIIRGLDAEFWTMQLVHARLLNLPKKWLDVFGESDHPHVLYLLGFTNPSSPCANVLKVGDIILSINGDIVSSVNELSHYDQEETLSMIIFRDGKEMNLIVPTTLFDGRETTRLIGWQGLFVQEPYQAAKEQMREKVPEGVYVSCCLFGSPAHVSIQVGVWITEINQEPVPTLDAFLSAVLKRNAIKTTTTKTTISTGRPQREDLYTHRHTPQQLRQKETSEWLLSQPTMTAKDDIETEQATHVRVKYVTRNNVVHVSMLRLDLHYWPTWQIQRDDTNPLGWTYQSFSSHI